MVMRIVEIFTVIDQLLMTRRSNSIPVDPIYGGCLQTQHKTNHPPLCLQVGLMMVVILLMMVIVMTMMINGYC